MKKAIPFLLTLFLLEPLSCTPKSPEEAKKDRFPKGYDLESMETISLPKKLREISGMAWYQENMLVVEDENGKLYQIDPKSGEILQETEFGKKGDYEDILIKGDTAWILRSDGDLFWVKGPTKEDPTIGQVNFKKKGNKDFETLLALPNSNTLLLMCKSCEWDKKHEASIFELKLDQAEIETEASGKISTRKEDLPFDNKEDFSAQPSAAAVHPLTGEVFLLSSAGEWLMILDQELNAKEIFSLDSRIFKQPEGLTFDPKGNLYISNEGGNGNSNLLFFPYKPVN